ncbi:ATP-binding protein [Tahibacter sp.]|uniref:ATP-binding protein n=1 Tax=Tahibacter sp. TaxID=2056211 RepID=UPI0028C46C61|nr:ATP-binding protein [Tahibacter sp.]
MSAPSVVEQLEALGLTHMAVLWARQERAEDPREAGARLAELVGAERSGRADGVLGRRRAAARLEQPSADLRDLRHPAERRLDGAVVRALGKLAWVEAGSHLVFTGGTGTGKTWLSCAMANAAIEQGRSVQAWAVPDLLAEWQASGDRLHLFRRRLGKLDLLILEDWGVERLRPEDASVIRRVVMDRIDRKSLLIASALPPSAWRQWLGGSLVADGLVDRLEAASQVIGLEGGSLRRRGVRAA